MSLIAWVLIIALSILWGSTYLFAEIALDALPPILIVWLRVSLAAVFLWGVSAFMRTKSNTPLSITQWRDIAIMSFFNNVVPFSTIVWAQTQLTGSLASIYAGTMPIFTVLLAHALGFEALKSQRLAGTIIGFVGLAILMSGDWQQDQPLWPQFIILVAALSYGIAVLWGRRLIGIPTITLATGQVSASALILLAPMLWIDQPWQLAWPAEDVVISIVILATACTGLAYLLYFRILAIAGPIHLSLVTFTIPPCAILMGWFWLGETLQTHHFIGLCVIFIGLWLINRRPA